MNEVIESTTDNTTTETLVEPESGNREAAKYRRQLRDTETNLETARAALTAARTELVRNAVTGQKVGGNTFNLEAFDDAGIDPDTLFMEDGKLNTEAITETMTALAESSPYLFTPPQRMIIPNEGNSPDNTTNVDNWQGAFAPKE